MGKAERSCTRYSHFRDLKMSDPDELEKLTRRILDRSLPAFSLKAEIDQLKRLFLSEGNFRPSEDIAYGETVTASGVAISPTMAAMCLDDFVRTIQFLRGTDAAISDIQADLTDRPVRVLYAGCGPWATLAIPLMAVTSNVTFTLLDIHSQSIDSAKSLLERFGFEHRVANCVVADASEHAIDAQKVPDIILVEIMRSGLTAEPQIAVSRHLVRQARDAILIPSNIRIDLDLIGPNRAIEQNEVLSLERDQIHIAEILSVDKETLFLNELPTTVIRIPEFDAERYRPMLCTEVCVYGDVVIRGRDSGITSPRAPEFAPKISAGEKIHISYRLGECPRLVGQKEKGVVSNTRYF